MEIETGDQDAFEWPSDPDLPDFCPICGIDLRPPDFSQNNLGTAATVLTMEILMYPIKVSRHRAHAHLIKRI